MASATFTPSNSTIADWLHFDWKTVPALTNCQLDNMNVSCTGVCNNSTALFAGPTNNLVNCGIWTSLVMGYTESEFNQTLGPTENASIYDSLFSPFQSLDLNASNFQNTSLYADTISHCFEFLYINVKRFSFADDGKTPAACTRPDLFPVTYGNTSLKDCVGEICSPLTLNPDLAGIGVSPQQAWDRRYMLSCLRYFPPLLPSLALLFLHLALYSHWTCGPLQGHGSRKNDRRILTRTS